MTIRHTFKRFALAVAICATMTLPAAVMAQEIESYATPKEYNDKGNEYLTAGNAAVAQKHFERAAAMESRTRWIIWPGVFQSPLE